MKTGRRGFLGLLAGIGAAAGVKAPGVKAAAPVTPVAPAQRIPHPLFPFDGDRYWTTTSMGAITMIGSKVYPQ